MDELARVAPGPGPWSWLFTLVRSHVRALIADWATRLAWLILALVLVGMGLVRVVSALSGILARWTGDPVLAEGLTGLVLLLLAGLSVRMAMARGRV